MSWPDRASKAEGLRREALALHGRGRTVEALALLRRAAGLAPGEFAIRFDLARLALAGGEAGEAAALAAELVAQHPATPAVRWLAARVAAAAGDWRQVLDHLAIALRHPQVGPEQRAELLLLQADALDALDDAPGAFAAAAQGKALQRALFAGQARQREGEVAKLTRLAEAFGRADAATWRAPSPAPGPASTHVFLVGFPRSGTTLLEQVLAGHPGVVALEEAPTLAAHYAELMSDAQGLQRLATLSEPEAEAWRGRYWQAVRAAGADPAGKLFLDKAPAGTLLLPLVARLFPKARVLFALRDPRDVVLSCFRRNFQLNAMTYAFTDLEEAAACYDACMRLAEIYRRLLPLAWRDVRHERLVADFDGELAGICGFLGLAAAPAMRDVAATSARRTVRTPSAVQVRAGLSRAGLERWRAYARELEPVRPVLAPWVERFGYGATE